MLLQYVPVVISKRTALVSLSFVCSVHEHTSQQEASVLHSEYMNLFITLKCVESIDESATTGGHEEGTLIA